MKKIFYFISDFLLLLRKLLRFGGTLAVIAENLVLRQQLLVVNRKFKKAPKLKILDPFIFAWLSLFINPMRFSKIAVIIRPATLLKFHKILVKRKYRMLFSKHSYKKPGPKGQTSEIIELVLEIKRRNPKFGYRRIAMQISYFFGIKIDKDIVRRILSTNIPIKNPHGNGPSWLTFFGHLKDSLWSVDLFRCESILLKSHWVLLVIDHLSRRIIGMAIHTGNVDDISLCCLFNKIILEKTPPKYLSTDHDPLFRFHRWLANLRILDIEEIKTVPYVPISHPTVERMIGTIRKEFLDQILFWNERDLQNKLDIFINFYNNNRCHWVIHGETLAQKADPLPSVLINLHNYQWKKYCKGLFELPIAA